MDNNTQESHGYSFTLGLLTGTVVGVGLALWLAPDTANEIRERVTDSAKAIGKRASDRYAQASARVNDSVDDLTRKGNAVRDEVAGSVARGAHEVARGANEVERMATAAKSEVAKARS